MNEEQSQVPVQESASKKKPIIIGLIVLALLAVTGYVVYAWQQNRIETLNKQIEGLQKKANSSDTASPTSATTVTYTLPGGYTEYKNTNPAFTFGYPKAWTDFKVTNIDNSTAAAKSVGAKGSAIQAVSYVTDENRGTENARFLVASTTYVPGGTDETLNVYGRDGYKSNYQLANGKIASQYDDFEVVKTRSGEGIIFVPEQGLSTKLVIGIVNMPSSSGHKSVSFLGYDLDELKKVLATVKIGN